MPVTPETLTRHELNGLYVEVVDAANPDLVGIAGRIVVETMNTLQIDTGAEPPGRARSERAGSGRSRVCQVPKQGTTFQFTLDEASRSLPAAREGDRPGAATDPSAGRVAETTPTRGIATDEAAGGREAPGTAPEPVSTPENPERARVEAGYDAAYVTVDGARLLSRPALRTETAGDSRWR